MKSHKFTTRLEIQPIRRWTLEKKKQKLFTEHNLMLANRHMNEKKRKTDRPSVESNANVSA